MYPNNKVCYKLKTYPNPIQSHTYYGDQIFILLDLFEYYKKNRRFACIALLQISHIPLILTRFL